MKDLLVYIASPIRSDTEYGMAENVRKACEAGIAVLKMGIAPLIPHLTVYTGQQTVPAYIPNNRSTPAAIPEYTPAGTTAEDWYGLGLVEVRRCDAVLRLPGQSKGADREVQEARHFDIPVFHSLKELELWKNEKIRQVATLMRSADADVMEVRI